MTEPVAIKGWCPTALRPMMSGDGLIVRVRVRHAAVAVEQVRALAALARHYGNGQLDLTQRATFQLRGIREDTWAPLIDALRRLDLVETDPDQTTSILVSPLAGLDASVRLDVRALADDIARRLEADNVGRALPAKFCFAIDGGGTLPLGEIGADITLAASTCGSGDDALLQVAGAPEAARMPLSEASSAAVCLARVFLNLRSDERRMRSLVARHGATALFAQAGLRVNASRSSPAFSPLPLGAFQCGAVGIVGVAAPFGAWSADDLEAVADWADRWPGTACRLTPWRVLLVTGVPREVDAPADLARRGLIVRADDPLLSVAACAGAPGCASAETATRAMARQLASRTSLATGIAVHVSGCAKGCAHPHPAPVTLVGQSGRFDLVIDGSARDSATFVGLDADAVLRILRERQAA